MKISVFFLIILLITGCGTRVSGSFEFPMQVNTFNKYNDPLGSSCKLYSSETRMEFTSPSRIRYQANCGPMNIICKTGTILKDIQIHMNLFIQWSQNIIHLYLK